jgi:hypothetical protein
LFRISDFEFRISLPEDLAMSKRCNWLLAWYLAAGAGLAMAAIGLGQSGERPLQKIFGSGSTKAAPAKAPAEDPRRRTEIDLELAWLADPLTFPYFLEARIEGATLTVRGYVPDKAVREHVLKLARVHTTYTIADNMKEHPSLLVRPGKESAAQLQAAVVSTLKEALPKQSQRLQVQCGADGTVTLRGQLQSAEEKLSASHALRRLYGCSSVQNLTQLPGEPEPLQAKPLAPPKNDGPLVGFGPLVPGKDANTGAPSKEPLAGPRLPMSDNSVQGPNLLPPKDQAPPAKKDEPVKEVPNAGAKLALSAVKIAGLQKRVLEVCAGAKDVKIELTPANKIRIELTVRSDNDITPLAGKVYSLPELMDYRDDVELYFTVGKEK